MPKIIDPVRRPKFRELEGLRGVAAFVVLLAHLRLTFFIEESSAFHAHLGDFSGRVFEALFDGNFAVWLFWTMSAFVLSLRFHETLGQENSREAMSSAAIRRYPRLVIPALASVVLAWFFLRCGLMTNTLLAGELGPKYQDWLGSFYLFEADFIKALKTATWQSFFSYDRSSTYNAVLWTMEVELIGSFFLFAFLALFGKHQSRLLFYIAAALIAAKLTLHWINAFTFGMLLSDIWVNRRRVISRLPAAAKKFIFFLRKSIWVFSFSGLSLLILIGSSNRFGILHLILAVVTTAFVIASIPANKVFSAPPLVFLGKISFGLYLVHLPIICVVSYPAYSVSVKYLDPLSARVCVSLLICLLSIAGGWLLWFMADHPAISISRKIDGLLKRGITRCGRSTACPRQVESLNENSISTEESEPAVGRQ
jgi:peptidoglycan/LPS O-acetylase OafA/YrhL